LFPWLVRAEWVSLDCFRGKRSTAVPRSVIEAVKMGHWDFEPDAQDASAFRATKAMPGTDEKLDVMAERVRQGMPLWHPADRRSYDAREQME